MSLLSDDIIKYFTDSGLIEGYTVQYDEFIEGDDSRYLAIIPDGGATARAWIRSPRYRVILVGSKNESAFAKPSQIGNVASGLIDHIRQNYSSEGHQLIDCTEPSPSVRTDSKRPMMQFSLMTMS